MKLIIDKPDTLSPTDLTVEIERPIDPRVRLMLIGIRQGLLIMIAAIESYLGMRRSIPPRRTRRKDLP